MALTLMSQFKDPYIYYALPAQMFALLLAGGGVVLVGPAAAGGGKKAKPGVKGRGGQSCGQGYLPS